MPDRPGAERTDSAPGVGGCARPRVPGDDFGETGGGFTDIEAVDSAGSRSPAPGHLGEFIGPELAEPRETRALRR